MEVKGVLLSGLTGDQKLVKMLSELKQISAKSIKYSHFEKRLSTYIAFANLCYKLKPLVSELRKNLKIDPRF